MIVYLPQGVSFGLIDGVDHADRNAQHRESSYEPPEYCGPHRELVIIQLEWTVAYHAEQPDTLWIENNYTHVCHNGSFLICSSMNIDGEKIIFLTFIVSKILRVRKISLEIWK